MTERNIIIHWGPVADEDISLYAGDWLKFVEVINTVFDNSQNPIVVEGSYSNMYQPNFDTVVLRRIPPETAVFFVNPGDDVTLYGCRTSVCVEMARQALVRILGYSHVKVSKDGVID